MHVTKKELRNMLKLAIQAGRADPTMAANTIADSVITMKRAATTHKTLTAAGVEMNRAGIDTANMMSHVKKVANDKVVILANSLGMSEVRTSSPSLNPTVAVVTRDNERIDL